MTPKTSSMPDYRSGTSNGDQIAQVLALVGYELAAALKRFAPFNSPHEGWAVIREELDELWEHVKANDGRGQDAVDEAIQIAAMATRYIIDLSSVSNQDREPE